MDCDAMARRQPPSSSTTTPPHLSLPSSSDLRTNDRLFCAVADVLRIPRSTIDLHRSFEGLGGTPQLAEVLRLSCLNWGLDLRTEDIMESRTLAELQAGSTSRARVVADAISSSTAITPSTMATTAAGVVTPNNSKPWTPRSPTQRSPRSRDGVESSLGSSTSDLFSLTPKYSSGDTCGSERRSVDSRGSKGGGPTRSDKEATESLLESSPQVFRAALVSPRAGFFEDNLVAFLVLAGNEDHATTETSDIRIIPQSKRYLAGSQVAALTLMLERAPGTHPMPSMWIILERMPLNADGRPERRKLQTWVQNMNEDLYQQILSLESQELMQEPSTDMELALQRLVSKVLKLPQGQVGMNFSFRQLGGDEISALEMVVACRAESLVIKPSDILASDSLAQLASQTSSKGDLTHRWKESYRESSEAFALSPMQRLYFETPVGGDGKKHTISNTDSCYRFNSSLLLRIKHTAVAVEDVKTAVDTVVAHHAMLRARFKPGDRGWTQSVAKSAPGAFRFGHQSIRTNEEMVNAIAKVQTAIDVRHGPTFAAEHFITDDGQQLLYIVAHHLVVDMVSWRVVVHDLDELLQHNRLLSEPSMPFRQWTELQRRAIEADEVDTTLPFEVSAGDVGYWGMESRPNTYGDTLKVGFSLGPELTSILQTTCNQAFRTDSADIYLAALLLSFAQTFLDRPAPILWNQEHGREPSHRDSEADIAETVGWFTSFCPVRIDTEAGDDFVNLLRKVKDVRRSIPRRGWPYFASRFLGSGESAPRTRDWPFEIMFTYAGSLQQLERENGILEQIDMPGYTPDSQTSDIGSAVGRIALFEVSALVDQGSTKVTFLYNRSSRHQERISQWIQSFEHLLLEAIGRLRYRHQELTLSDVENVLPVTALQQEALISQSQAVLTCYNHFTYELVLPSGQIPDGARICNAWEHVVSARPALRTVFIDSLSVDGLFDQVVLRKCSPRMLFIEVGKDEDPVMSLNALPPLRCNGSEPRHRLTVCKSKRSTFVKLEISQALCDTTSIGTLMADLTQAYTHGKSAIRIPEVSYPGDYLQYLEPTRLANSLGFWKDRLMDLKPCLFPRLTPTRDNVANNLSFELDITTADFDTFCHTHEVDRSAIIRLSWALVLHAYTADKNVCFGYRCSGRDVPGLFPDGMQNVVGCFENTIICTISLPADSSLLSILHIEDEQLSTCLPHHTASISEINHAIGLCGEQLFNTSILFLDDRPSSPPRLRFSLPLDMKPLQYTCIMSYNTLDNDISVSSTFQGGRLTVHITHRILSLPQLHNLVSAFSRAITVVLSQPEITVGSVDLFTESDRGQLQVWEALDQQAPPAEGTVQNLFIKAVKTRPEAPAVCAWDGDFTYRQVSKLSSRLAHQLIDHGVGPGVPVPVVLDKNRWAIIAMLAVLRAGGCVVPIDSEDISYVEIAIKQLNAKVILATDVIYKAVEKLVPEVLLVNDGLLTAAILTSDNPSPRVKAQDPACIILSPCAPKSKEAKGIFFTHDALASAFQAHGKALGLNNESRVMQLSMFGVHTTLAEVFATLAHGGCICIPSHIERVEGFERAVNRMRVTWSYMTPMLARRVNPADVESLATVCFRTRMLDEDTFAPWSASKKVLLAYGAPDICPLGISVLEVKDTTELSLIARPMLGNFWIVSAENNRQLMPIGAAGELVVQSPTLSHKFYPGHAIAVASSDLATGSTPKIRYFKTGHRARYTDTGSMQFLSSTRDEIVVRGREVPVGTLEQQIRRCLGSGIDVAVEAVTPNDGEKTLAVFIEMENDLEASENISRLSPAAKEKVFILRRAIQSALRNSVQTDFIPSIYVPIKRLPMTPSLKVNRRKLQKMVSWMTHSQLEALSQVPNPDHVRADELKPLPLTHVEEHMRTVWSRILGLERSTISGTDVFLKLGGDAFLAARLVVACRHAGLLISIRDVLRGASLTELSQSIIAPSEAEPYTEPASDPDPAAKIAEYLTKEMPNMGVAGCEGMAATMEEVIENPTTGKQMDMLTRKIQGPKGGWVNPVSWGRSLKRRLTGSIDKGHANSGSGAAAAASGGTSPTRPAMNLDMTIEGAVGSTGATGASSSPISRGKSHSRSRSLTHAFSREHLRNNSNGHDDAQDNAYDGNVPRYPSSLPVPEDTGIVKTVDSAATSRLHSATEMGLGSFALESIQAATATVNGLRSPPSLEHKSSFASLQEEHPQTISTNADATYSLPSPRGLSSIGMGLKKMVSADSQHEMQPLPRQHTFGDSDVIPEEEEPLDEEMPILEVKRLRYLPSAVQYSAETVRESRRESRVAEVVDEDDDGYEDEYEDDEETASPLSPESRTVVIGMERSRESTAAVTAAGEAAIHGRGRGGDGGGFEGAASRGSLGSQNKKKKGLSHSRKGSDTWLRMSLSSSSRQGASNTVNGAQGGAPAVGV